ncbi:SAF domain-containing protein [Actinomyces sp. B33]|uniref:SAF domain-containing protein n=1 Tax=Actinomyces sp. B33 TaxID=2942131 RepID=UPI00233FDC8C|nr:SAF domain-containing protein [Actinomyces sp. B33]MDC4232176.1 SAF domain-containing protein [Actinomyces sp. B33]
MERLTRRPVLRIVLTSLALAGVVAGSLLAMRAAEPGRDVLVAARDLTTGDALAPADVRIVRVPEEAAASDALNGQDRLPQSWRSLPVASGTILTESLVAGSVDSRALGPHEARISLVVEEARVPRLEAGDTVDVWSIPGECDERGCSSSLLAGGVRIVSILKEEGPHWQSSPLLRIDVIVDERDSSAVLGHSGAENLSLALRTSR